MILVNSELGKIQNQIAFYLTQSRISEMSALQDCYILFIKSSIIN